MIRTFYQPFANIISVLLNINYYTTTTTTTDEWNLLILLRNIMYYYCYYYFEIWCSTTITTMKYNVQKWNEKQNERKSKHMQWTYASITAAAAATTTTTTATTTTMKYKVWQKWNRRKIKEKSKHVHQNLRPGSNVVSADNIAATVKAWDKQPHSFASINILESEDSSGSSAKY